MIRGIIFDLDGTLGDTLPVCFQAFGSVFERRLGRRYSDAEIQSMFGPSEEGVLARHFPDDFAGALHEYLREYRCAHRACTEPFPGLREALDFLRERGVHLAVVTGKGPRSAQVSLEALGLTDYFPIVEAGSPTGGVKPEAMRRVLRAWGVAPRSVVGVGDSPSDIRSAKEVAVQSVAAAWAPGSSSRKLAACAPERLFRNVAAFRAWLEAVVQPVR